jgi:predicted nucleic acid-binding protein
MKSLRSPLLTCWPVITEAAWLLRNEPGGFKTLGELVRTGSVKLVELDEPAFSWTMDFLDRYANLGAQIADVAVMYVAERERIRTVFMLDRRDFSIYRTSASAALKSIPEP